MSTKIYTAYRLKKSSDLWPFVHDCYTRGERAVVNVFRRLLRSSSYDAITAKYREQAGSPYRNEWNFDVTIAIRERRGRIYVIPHCDMRMAKACDFLKRDRRLDDFAYWNNTDRPKTVTARAWAHRACVWNALSAAGWGNCLTVTICDVSRLPVLLWEAQKKR